MYLRAIQAPKPTPQDKIAELRVSTEWRLLLKDEDVLVKRWPSHVYPAGEGTDWGFTWAHWKHSLQQLISEPMARALDSLVVELKLRYLEPEEEK